jgi:hypothetical protein
MTNETDSFHTRQWLYLVIGGELVSVDSLQFKDVSKIDLVGIYPSSEEAKAVWKARAQATVDNALMRYFVVDLNNIPPFDDWDGWLSDALYRHG